MDTRALLVATALLLLGVLAGHAAAHLTDGGIRVTKANGTPKDEFDDRSKVYFTAGRTGRKIARKCHAAVCVSLSCFFFVGNVGGIRDEDMEIVQILACISEFSPCFHACRVWVFCSYIHL